MVYLPSTPKTATPPASAKASPKSAVPALAPASSPVRQLLATLDSATNVAVVRTRAAIKSLGNPPEEQAQKLLYQHFSLAVGQDVTVKAGQVFGPTGTKQLDLINQALAAAFLPSQTRQPNLEDFQNLARYRTQLLADLSDATASPAQKAQIKEKLSAAYALAQKALASTGREQIATLLELPQAIVPQNTWSNTYREAAMTMMVSGRTANDKNIGNALSDNLIGTGIGELPQLAVGAAALGGVAVGAGLKAIKGRLAARADAKASQPTTRAQYEEAQQQARTNAYRYDSKKVASSQLYLDVNPAVRTGETPQQAAARVGAANAELRVRFPNIAKLDANLASVRGHVLQNDFVARGSGNTSNGQINLQTGSAASVPIASAKGMVIEPIPNNKFGKPISRFDFYNTPNGPRSGYLSGADTALPTTGGYDIRFMTEVGKTPQGKPKYGEAAQWNAGNKIPAGYRVKLKPSEIKKNGFSGGHSTEAWNETLKTYGDLIKVDVNATKNIFFKPAANRPIDRASQYTYTFNGQPVKQPKTVGGSSQTLKLLEPTIANEVGKILASGPITGNTTITVRIPVLNRNNKTVMLPVDVMIRKDPATGTINIPTWYVSDKAFSIGGLK